MKFFLFFSNLQSASKLLDTGLNTVQSTLLLKKQVEVEKVQEDLDIKRRQFAERMAACKAKEEELKKKQAQVKEKLKPNWAFLLLGEVLTAGLKKSVKI